MLVMRHYKSVQQSESTLHLTFMWTVPADAVALEQDKSAAWRIRGEKNRQKGQRSEEGRYGREKSKRKKVGLNAKYRTIPNSQWAAVKHFCWVLYYTFINHSSSLLLSSGHYIVHILTLHVYIKRALISNSIFLNS